MISKLYIIHNLSNMNNTTNKSFCGFEFRFEFTELKSCFDCVEYHLSKDFGKFLEIGIRISGAFCCLSVTNYILGGVDKP